MNEKNQFALMRELVDAIGLRLCLGFFFFGTRGIMIAQSAIQTDMVGLPCCAGTIPTSYGLK